MPSAACIELAQKYRYTYFSHMKKEERHYRNVARLPCARCGIQDYSQAAHSNLAQHGKGGGLKANWLNVFPLCCTRPGILGCHAEHDQYVGMTYEEGVERTRKYLRWTEEQLRARGQWPDLPDEPEVKVSKLARKDVGQKAPKKAIAEKPARPVRQLDTPKTERPKNKSRWPVGAGRGFPTKQQSNEAMQSRIVAVGFEKTSAPREKSAHVWPKRDTAWPTRGLKSANRLGGRK